MKEDKVMNRKLGKVKPAICGDEVRNLSLLRDL